MIFQKEIAQKAQEWEVAPNTVDKDYVLGHFLNCFFNFGNHRDVFVFKGGTCLRKCHFPNYRFSEDLDFTLLDSKYQIDMKLLAEIAHSCSQHSGVLFDVNHFEKKQFQNAEKGYQFIIKFWGANHSKNIAPPPSKRWTTKIKLDISFDEEILFPVQQRYIHHPYTDNHLISENPIPTYTLEEILTEKIRAFFQRSYKAPRDFYDVWFLFQNHHFGDWNKISEILQKKCDLKKKMIDTQSFNDTKIYQTVLKS